MALRNGHPRRGHGQRGHGLARKRRRHRQYRYALGLQYDWRKNISFGAAYEYMDAGSAPVNQTGGVLRGDLKGRFKDDAFSIVALNMNWKF